MSRLNLRTFYAPFSPLASPSLDANLEQLGTPSFLKAAINVEISADYRLPGGKAEGEGSDLGSTKARDRKLYSR